MGKLLILTSCCFFIAASQSPYPPEHLETNLLLFKDEPKAGHVEAFQDNYVKEIFAKLLRRRLPHLKVAEPIKVENPESDDIEEPTSSGSEVLSLHSQLQNKLGWESDDNNGGNFNQNSVIVLNNPPHGQSFRGPPPPQNGQSYGPPPNIRNNQAYGPPPQQNGPSYGPPPPPRNNQAYGPPPQQNGPSYGPPPPPRNNQAYGPPPQQNGPSYGPPPPPRNNQAYGPPPQQNGPTYGPPPPPQNNQAYGPPPQQNNQAYGPPPQQNNQAYGPPPQQNNQAYGPPPQQNNQAYGPPPQQNNHAYGPPPVQNDQSFGPPVPVRENSQDYGGPPPPPPQNSFENNALGQGAFQSNQEYGAPQGNSGSNHGGYQSNNEIRVNQGNFGGYIENFSSGNRGSLNQQTAALQSQGQSQFSNNGNSGLNDGAKIYKHVYIHTPTPEEEPPQQPRVISLNKKQDTHYQIIFVKAPAPPQMPPTEIELPAPPERKTLVYVLVKKPQKPAEIKFRAPAPTSPAKPEVYFIKYKGNGQPNDQEMLSEVEGNLGVSNDQRINEGYSNSLDVQPQSIDEVGGNGGRTPDSVGYPNTKYRAPPSMLSPNQEPMSIAVYDRVRNGVSPTAGGAATISSNNQRTQQGGSHYRAPGAQLFDRASGRMMNGQYIGMTSMTSNSRGNQYYS
ncbi:unnamed protein product [Orchesella dallaii]|uniref:DUF243 domain-containing protein n=1 Tax=Orchesella dallaii TaxID=48710 RepID=A0ABP1RDD4_9HEXA